jgi:AcrR family transcriptional regulator
MRLYNPAMTQSDSADSPNNDSKPKGGTQKGLETRSRIIRGARTALENDGIDALTTRKIAASANVRLATLHYYFDSKDSILLAVLEDMLLDMQSSYNIARPFSDSIEERIADLIRLIWHYIRQTRNRQIAQIELTIYALRTKGAEWLAEKQYQTYIDFYSHLIHDEAEISDVEKARIGKAVARFILIGIDGLILQTFALDDAVLANDSVDALIQATQYYYRQLAPAAD